MSLVDKHIGQRLVEYSFSPPRPKPEVVIKEVVRQDDTPSKAVQEKLSRQDDEITKLGREVELLTLLLKQQTEETKIPALYLGRKASGR